MKVTMRSAFTRLIPALMLPMALQSVALSAEPFKLGVQEKGYVNSSPIQGYADYPAPTMVPQQGQAGIATPLKTGIQQTAPRPPLQTGISKPVALPPPFLGAWNVQGQRVKVEAVPEFQAGAEQAFAMTTQNVWSISGSPQGGYSMGSNTGIRTPLVVDSVQGSTAFIRYQHPIGKTMAQEAIVMTLTPTGVQFNGLERISIVKEGAPPRARVTYQLTGFRQK
jgi:hypothetical protein